MLLLAASAILFQRSATAPWTQATAADGTRYVVSPIGLVEFKGDRPSPASECRWWPTLGNRQLCALNDVAGPQHMSRLSRAYPLTVIALWMSVLALFLNALRVPRQAPGIRPALALAPTALAAVAIWSVWSSAPRALAVLEGLAPSPVWTGFGPVVAGIVFTVTAAALLTTSGRRALRPMAIVLAMVFGSATTSPAQVATQDAPSSRCWRFAFGTWTPPLNWEAAGHRGAPGEMSERVQRIRDSVFAKDTNAVRNNAMVWERTSNGWSVVLFPPWWPVGVKVDFDSVLAGGSEMTGQAVAFVADASRDNSRARARAVRCPA